MAGPNRETSTETNSTGPSESRREFPREAVGEFVGESSSSNMNPIEHDRESDASEWFASCPSPSLLKELVQETLADHLVESTSTHLETCRHCQATVEQWLDGVVEEASTQLQIPGYDVGAELGRGGMGIVYLARRLSDGESVALKVLAPHSLDRPESLQRFQKEVETLDRLNHPGIVRISESGCVGRQPWFAMELVGGPNLGRFLDSKPQPPIFVADFMLQITTAVEVAHQQRIVHRDLKPSNILLQPVNSPGQITGRTLCDYQPKIVDFGIAKWLGNTTSTDLTRTGDLIGSLEYMSPEVLLGESRGDTHSDIYALGALLYELLVGRPPIIAMTVAELIRRAATESPIPPRQFDPTIPVPLETICLKCLYRQASDRYASTEELRRDLERFLDGQRVLARPLPLPRRIILWGKQRPVAMTATVLSVGSISLIICLMVWNQWRLIREKNKTEENYRVAVETVETTFDEFFRMLGILAGEGTTFDSGGIVDQQLEKLVLLEKQRPDDLQLQLLLAKLEAARAERENDYGIQQRDQNQQQYYLKRSLALIKKSLWRTARLHQGEFKIKALEVHEHSCRVASEIYRNLNDLKKAKDILNEGSEAVDELRVCEPQEWRHIPRRLYFLTEASMITWIDWNSGRLSTPSMLKELTKYEEDVASAARQLNELEVGTELEATAPLGSAYQDLAEWYFLLGQRLTPEHYQKALAYNRKAIEIAKEQYAFLPNARNAYMLEKLLINFCNVDAFRNDLDTEWLDLRKDFYQRLQQAALPSAMAGNRFLNLQRAIQYELDIVEQNLSDEYFLTTAQWEELRRHVDNVFSSLLPDSATRFTQDCENLKQRIESRLVTERD